LTAPLAPQAEPLTLRPFACLIGNTVIGNTVIGNTVIGNTVIGNTAPF
jgi:hypothetical protein